MGGKTITISPQDQPRSPAYAVGHQGMEARIPAPAPIQLPALARTTATELAGWVIGMAILSIVIKVIVGHLAALAMQVREMQFRVRSIERQKLNEQQSRSAVTVAVFHLALSWSNP